MMADSTPDHSFSATFGDRILRIFHRTLDLDGPVTVETTDDRFTVGRVDHGSVLSVAVTIDADAFESFDNATGGRTLVRGASFDGIVDILRGLGIDHENTFSLTVEPDRLALRDTDSTLGGEMPRNDRSATPPDVSDFADELTCETSINAPAAVDSLYRDADCSGEDGIAEVRAVDGESFLTMSGDDSVYAELGDTDHPNDETPTGHFAAEYVHEAFDALVPHNNPTTLRWGADHPLVLEMTTEHRDYQAVVAPRFYKDLDEPVHETATELDSVGAAVAGGFQ